MSRNKSTRLELTWIGKENRPRLKPRILLGDPEKSCHTPHRVCDHGMSDSDSERRFAVVLENDEEVLKWLKSGRGAFRIHYTEEAE